MLELKSTHESQRGPAIFGKLFAKFQGTPRASNMSGDLKLSETCTDVNLRDAASLRPALGLSNLKYDATHTENQELSWCQLCRHGWHSRLSWRQPPVPAITTKLASWQPLDFSGGGAQREVFPIVLFQINVSYVSFIIAAAAARVIWWPRSWALLNLFE